MAEFTLPSGRVIELREPTFGQEMAIVAAGHDNLAELMYAKCVVIAPSISREEIEAMPRADGRALVVAVGKVWDGRPEEQEAPFGNGSASPSTDSEQTPTTSSGRSR
jgi:hypothetical protein